MPKFVIKLVLFSGAFILVHFISETFVEYSCGHLYDSRGIICNIAISLLLYASLLMSISLGWRIKPTLSAFAGLIPLPMFILSAANMKITGAFNQLRPEVIDVFSYYFFSYSLPCLIVAVAISYATNREVSNAR